MYYIMLRWMPINMRYVQKVCGFLLSFFTGFIKTPFIVDMNRKSVFISKSKIYFYCKLFFLYKLRAL
jgi:hypothetical protein